MSPSYQENNTKSNNNIINGTSPPPLKINKNSHIIKKSSSPSLSSPPSSSSVSSASSQGVSGTSKPPQQRHPVIIYTHSPKVIHTHPKDFMTLVQKLTGLSRNEDDHKPKQENSSGEKENRNSILGNEDNDSNSVITVDENCGEGQVNSCFVPPPFHPMNNIPAFTPNSAAGYYCTLQQNHPSYLNYNDYIMFDPLESIDEGINGFDEY